MTISDREYFRQLPQLAIESVSSLAPGGELALLLMEYTESGVGIIFPLRYVHQRFVGSVSVHRHATAFGRARFTGCDRLMQVTIGFSGFGRKATLHGLPVEGEVKAGQPAYSNLEEFLTSFN